MGEAGSKWLLRGETREWGPRERSSVRERGRRRKVRRWCVPGARVFVWMGGSSSPAERGAGRPRPGSAGCGAGHDLGSRRRGGQRPPAPSRAPFYPDPPLTKSSGEPRTECARRADVHELEVAAGSELDSPVPLGLRQHLPRLAVSPSEPGALGGFLFLFCTCSFYPARFRISPPLFLFFHHPRFSQPVYTSVIFPMLT